MITEAFLLMKLPHLSLVCALVACFANCGPAANTNQTATISNTSTPPVNANTPPLVATTAPPANANVAVAAAEDFTASRALYTQHCTACHGAGGVGQNMGSMKIPSLKAPAAVELTDAAINNYITNGALDKGMPAFKGKLTKTQIEDMVRYIRVEIQGQTAKAGAPKTAG